MNDHEYRPPEEHACERICSAGGLWGYVHPLVRALPEPTAHPTAEAWQRERRGAGGKRARRDSPVPVRAALGTRG